MITSMQIFKVVVKLCKEATGINEIYSVSTEEGFAKECIYVEYVAPSVSGIGKSYVMEDTSIRVSYFQIAPAKFKNVLEVKDLLQKAFFNGFFVTDEFYIPLTSMEFQVTKNKVLEMLIQFSTVQEIAETDAPLIENLEYNITKED